MGMISSNYIEYKQIIIDATYNVGIHVLPWGGLRNMLTQRK